MNFYLDFDYTLFDTYAFRKELYKILKRNGLSKDCLALTSEEEEHELLNVRNVFKHLSEKENLPLDNFIVPLEKLYKKSYKYLYKDVVKFIRVLKAEGHFVNILTWGNEEYQKEKIVASRIYEKVDHIICTEKLKYKLDLDYENGIFIDDSIRDLKGLYVKKAKYVFRIKRKHGKNSKDKLDINEILEFNSLAKLERYLRKAKII